MFFYHMDLQMFYLVIFIFLFLFTNCSIAEVRLKNFDSFVKQDQVGLYNSSDNVLVLSSTNFKNLVHRQNKSILVEFYNSYCGHCKRFAPKYKDLALQLYPWRDVLSISAIDCAVEESNDICREYEVMAYPTLRYFGPGYYSKNKSYGISLETQNIDSIRYKLATFLANETKIPETWANLQILTESESEHLFDDCNKEKKLIIVIYEPINSTVAIETALKYHRWPNLQIRRVANLNIAKKFLIDITKTNISSIDCYGKITSYAGKQNKLEDYFKIVQEIIIQNHFEEKKDNFEALNINDESGKDTIYLYGEVIDKVKQNKHFIYQADLEMAIRISLFNEIPKISNISGEKLLALQQFLLTIKHYNPLDVNGKVFLSQLYEFVMLHNQKLSGKEFESEVNRLASNLSTIFHNNHFVGCISLRPGLRGFTCSLWQFFHYLTVQAAQNDDDSNVLHVLQVVYGYVKYYFGCTDCSNHFQSMAAKMNIWNVTTKNEAILWLWAAHNKVNERLSGDLTEDPDFPKIQYPTLLSCSKCFTTPAENYNSTNINWNKNEVLNFLKRIYSSENINLYGIRKNFLTLNYETPRQKRNIVSAFSEVDIRMGMFLYAFCIVIILVAFKLFTFKKYRKKPYGYDLLGKV